MCTHKYGREQISFVAPTGRDEAVVQDQADATVAKKAETIALV